MLPEGLIYRPGVLTEAEERDGLAVLAAFELYPETAELTREPRSAYVLSGPARTQWQHHIPPVTDERWSMTFRTLRHAAAGAR
jgi:hypothetical protein